MSSESGKSFMGLAEGTPISIILVPCSLMTFGVLLERTLNILGMSQPNISLYFISPAVLFFLFCLYFFRDPDRSIGAGIVSAADGKVTHVEQTEDGVRVNVFMSPLDVHVNRAPVAGKAVSITHHDGGHIPAFNKDSEKNERVVVEWDTEIGKVTTIQIAGSLARRIIPYISEGDELVKGERYGLIRLGSRLDHFLPPGCELKVKKGDKVIGGVTTIAVVGGEM
jgi:phosphatidylserine decarboxylase